MPIYEYQCTACGHQLEAFQKFSEEPLKECPECGKPDLQKLVSSSAFHLKGGGWYVTDIRDKDKKKPEAAKDNAGSTKTEDSSDKKSGGSSNNSTDSSAG
ncbi:MAG TPA: zinc ribbon domain-containing protein [Gammaproteobacteria bacterium]|jgi:putative FmdB family regulatory protein|nr:zinc ribbon domain-containing protein [Gammaproteobacteria bacterium]